MPVTTSAPEAAAPSAAPVPVAMALRAALTSWLRVISREILSAALPMVMAYGRLMTISFQAEEKSIQ